MRKTLFVVIVLVICVSLLTACFPYINSPIVGKWKRIEGNTFMVSPAEAGAEVIYDFWSDGNLAVTVYDEKGNHNTYDTAYTVNGNSFGDGGSYEINGDQLKIVHGDGTWETLVRMQDE